MLALRYWAVYHGLNALSCILYVVLMGTPDPAYVTVYFFPLYTLAGIITTATNSALWGALLFAPLVVYSGILMMTSSFLWTVSGSHINALMDKHGVGTTVVVYLWFHCVPALAFACYCIWIQRIYWDRHWAEYAVTAANLLNIVYFMAVDVRTMFGLGYISIWLVLFGAAISTAYYFAMVGPPQR